MENNRYKVVIKTQEYAILRRTEAFNEGVLIKIKYYNNKPDEHYWVSENRDCHFTLMLLNDENTNLMQDIEEFIFKSKKIENPNKHILNTF